MIYEKPLKELSIGELFPSPADLRQGNDIIARRAFLITFCSVDLARSVIGKDGIPEVWATAFLAATHGIKDKEESEDGIRQACSNLHLGALDSSDIRLYSILRRVGVARGASGDPDGFNEKVTAALRMLIGDQKEGVPAITSCVWGCVRDAFLIYDKLTDIKGQIGENFVFPGSGELLRRIRGFAGALYTEKGWGRSKHEPWEDYATRLWDGVRKYTFPHYGLSERIPDSLHEKLDGKKLRDHRVALARDVAHEYPRGFKGDLLNEVDKPFLTCALFDGEFANYRNLISDGGYKEAAYKRQYKDLLKDLRYSVPMSAMTRAGFDGMMADGEFKAIWQLSDDAWDDWFCDRPQDGRALNDLRLFGEKGGRVVYSILMLNLDPDKVIDWNIRHIATTHGGDDPVVVRFKGTVKEQATISWGSSRENFVVIPYTIEALAWLVEARFFIGVVGQDPDKMELLNKAAQESSLWREFLQVTSGQKHPYIEMQIHGRIGPEHIKSAIHIVDGECVEIKEPVAGKSATNNKQSSDSEDNK